jgi:ferritin
MEISKPMSAKLNDQITHELDACQRYLAITAYFEGLGLKVLAGRFLKQSDEERGHALRIFKYLVDVGAKITLAALPKPKADFPSVVAAIEAACDSERTVSQQINDLVALAEKEKDYSTRTFLQWFVNEQIEEVATMTHLARVARLAGDDLLELEAYVAQIGETDDLEEESED